MIVDVAHPVPMRFVPKGARNPVDRFVGVTSPVRLTEADRRRTDFVAQLHYSHTYFAHDDCLWVSHQERASLENLGAVLGGDGRDPMFMSFFPGTPVRLAQDRHTADEAHPRGEPPPDRPRAILQDGTAEAVSRLQAFFDRNVRIVEGRVLFRAEMGAVINPDIGTFFGVDHPHAAMGQGLIAPMGRQAELVDFVRRHGIPRGGEALKDARQFTRTYAKLPLDLMPKDHDVGYMVNHLALQTARFALLAFAQRGMSGTYYGATRAARESIAPFVPRARLGLLEAEHFTAVLEVARGLADSDEVAFCRNLDGGPFRRMARYAATVVLPRAVPAIAAEDEDALSGLGPGGL